MAVVERKDSKGSVFYAVNQWNGRQKSERVGRNRRDAERRDAAMKREIAAGTYQPPRERKDLSVGDLVSLYHGKRTIKSKDDERALSRNHLEPRPWIWSMPARHLRPAHCDRLISELRALTRPDGSRRLTDKSIMDVLALLKRVFASAMRAELVDRQPVLLERGTWNHTPKVREPYTAAEAMVLTHHHRIPWPTRVLIALWMLAGLRQGEGCGLKWKRLDDHTRPLAGLTIAEQWRGETLKTKRPRIVPVHPVLLAILREWAESGFEAYTGRKPTPEDYIVPELDGFGAWNCFGAHTSYRRFQEACELVGIRARTLHACRHTFVTLCRRGGARADVLERVSHNASGKMIDRYTHFDWAPLCEAVLCMDLESLPTAPPLAGNIGVIELPELTDEAGISLGETTGAATDLVVCSPRQSRSGSNKAVFLTDGATVQAGTQGAGGELPGQGRRWDHALLRSNEARQAKLMALAAADPAGAAPGLAFCRAYEATLRGNGQAALTALQEAAQALGLAGGGR